MSYTKPENVLTPKGSISNLEVLYDGGENSWSLASMKWDGVDVLGMRWNGGSNNGTPSVGTPQSRGYPTWFVVPEEVGDAIKNMLALSKKMRR
jgi:hypothetical protein